jgi:predicted nucleic acid-binding protein
VTVPYIDTSALAKWLHLAIALEHSAKVLATADRVMAAAGKSLGLKVVAFF